MTTINNAERRALAALRRDQNTWINLPTLMATCEFTDASMAVGAAQGLVEEGFAEVSEEVEIEIELGEEGIRAIERGLVEHLLLEMINQSEGVVSMDSLHTLGPLERHELGPAIGHLKRLGMQMEDNNVSISSENRQLAEKQIQQRMAFLTLISKGGAVDASSL